MCMLDNSDGNVNVLSKRRPVARKTHRCEECKRLIDIGERYLFEAFVFDGKFHAHRTCAHCLVAREWLGQECGGFLYGCVEEDFREHCHSGGYAMDLYRLVVGMEWRWRTPKGRLMPVPSVPETSDQILAKESKNG